MFLLAYLTNYLLFEVTSILSLFLGMTLVFAGLETYIRSRPANMIAKSPLVTLKETLEKDGKIGNALFYYDQDKIPLMKLDSDNSASRTLSTVGNDLMKLYEEEIGSIDGKGFDYVREWIPKILQESLKLSDRVTIEKTDGKVKASLLKPSFELLCLSPELKNGICDKIGCQVQASICQAIARGTTSKVRFDGCVYDSATRESVASYTLLDNTP